VLERGIASYEDGDYRAAERQLQTALDMGLAAPGDQATAHKYLAFIHCDAGRAKRCREEFRKALGAEPSFELEPAEAGHPAWGPVFRSVKANRV
jgi:Tfp pilus assembly protein PilF